MSFAIVCVNSKFLQVLKLAKFSTSSVFSSSLIYLCIAGVGIVNKGSEGDTPVKNTKKKRPRRLAIGESEACEQV